MPPGWERSRTVCVCARAHTRVCVCMYVCVCRMSPLRRGVGPCPWRCGRTSEWCSHAMSRRLRKPSTFQPLPWFPHPTEAQKQRGIGLVSWNMEFSKDTDDQWPISPLRCFIWFKIPGVWVTTTGMIKVKFSNSLRKLRDELMDGDLYTIPRHH